MDKKLFSLPINSIEASEISNGDFIKIKLYAIQNGINRNKSEFLQESFEYGMSTIKNKPVLAYFNTDIGDTEEHNSKLNIDEFGELFYDYDYEGAEKPVGVIPESASIYVEDKDDKKWIVIDSALIWTEYNKRLSDLIKKQISKKVSVEVEQLEQEVIDDIEYISKWKFLGITILGKDTDGVEYQEGIEGAHLVLSGEEFEKKFKNFVNRMNYSLNKNTILSKYIEPENKEIYVQNNDFGSEKSIRVDKQKESVSNDAWGNVDKTNLRNTVLKAKNYKSLVKQVYLVVEDGWQDSPSEKLKYPVMQYKDGKLVYNSNGLLSAQQYGEQHDKAVAKKAISIRKKLGLIKSEKEENMKKFIEYAADAGFVFLGLFNESLRFVKAEEACDDKEMESKDKMEVYEIERQKAEEFDDETEDFSWDDVEGKEVRMVDEEEDKDEDHEDEKPDDEKPETDGKKEEVAEEPEEEDTDHMNEVEEKPEEENEDKKMAEKYKADYDALVEKYTILENELKEMKFQKFKNETDSVIENEVEDITVNDKDNLRKMRDEGKFNSIDDLIHEIAYIQHNNRKYSKKKLDYSVDVKTYNITDNEDDNDYRARLAKI